MRPMPRITLSSIAFALVLVCLASLVPLGCRVTDAPIWTEEKSAVPSPCDIEEVKDIPYASALKIQPFRHKLDLILPAGKKDLSGGGAGARRGLGHGRQSLLRPVHRGRASSWPVRASAWCCPIIVCRPGVKHPDHVKDLAKVAGLDAAQHRPGSAATRTGSFCWAIPPAGIWCRCWPRTSSISRPRG